MNLSSIPVIKLPLINVSTDPFDLLLVGLGLRMQQLSKTSPKFIELLHGRNFTLQLESKNGISRHFIIQDEQVKMGAGTAEKPDFTLRFEDSLFAVQTLLKGDPTVFMTGMQSGKIQMEGDFSLLMWFNQAAKLIAPKIPKPVLKKIKLAQRFISEKTAALKG